MKKASTNELFVGSAPRADHEAALEEGPHRVRTLRLHRRSVPFEAQKLLRVQYKGHLLQKEYVADLICYGQVLVELKAMKELSSREESQLLNYLKATRLRVGLLINFGDPGRLEWMRLVR